MNAEGEGWQHPSFFVSQFFVDGRVDRLNMPSSFVFRRERLIND